MSRQNQAGVIKVLMVCLGNICRSPTAHGVFQNRIESHSMGGKIAVDSAGTGDWHIGECPDHRAIDAAGIRGYRLDKLRARQVKDSDYTEFDYILAMDRNNLSTLMAACPPQYQHKLGLFLSWVDCVEDEVPDPYYGGPDGFELVLDRVEAAADKLISQLISRHFSQQ